MIPATDKEGYLLDTADWTREVAEVLAEEDGIALEAEHWELIDLVRDFYRRYETSPSMRPLVKQVRQQLGSEKGSSRYLLMLFPGDPPKRLARIAGLPRPTNCL